ncbi:hypothetical protein LTR67_003677 [Exophiala xenobiotica]
MGRAGLVMIVTQQKPQILYQLGASNGQGNDHIDTLGVRPRAVQLIEDQWRVIKVVLLDHDRPDNGLLTTLGFEEDMVRKIGDRDESDTSLRQEKCHHHTPGAEEVLPTKAAVICVESSHTSR